MSLHALKGKRGEVDRAIVLNAARHAPSLLVDAANVANIHSFDIDRELFAGVFVVQAESLYRFTPTLKQIPLLARQVNARRVFITTFTHLFDYDNQQENSDVFDYSWAIIARIAGQIDVQVGIEQGTVHERLALFHNAEVDQVGHTMMSQRIVADLVLGELAKFGKSMREEDRLIYGSLLKTPLKYLGSISYASSANTWAFLLFAAMVEQQKKINGLEDEIARLAAGHVQDE